MQGGKLQGVQEPDCFNHSSQKGKRTPIRQICGKNKEVNFFNSIFDSKSIIS